MVTGHAVDAVAGIGLLQSTADYVLTRTFGLPAADGTPIGKTLGVIQVVGVRLQASLQYCEG